MLRLFVWKTTMKRILFFLTFALLPLYAETLQGLVIKVADGDTITVLDANKQQHKIRLNWIDAPESKQAFGQVSKKYLDEMVYKKNVTIEYEKKDMYGRILGFIKIDGKNVNLEMVKAGMAWHYEHFAKNATDYAEAQKQAKLEKKGLWKDPNPIPPWDFRKNAKNSRKQKNENSAK